MEPSCVLEPFQKQKMDDNDNDCAPLVACFSLSSPGATWQAAVGSGVTTLARDTTFRLTEL